MCIAKPDTSLMNREETSFFLSACIVFDLIVVAIQQKTTSIRYKFSASVAGSINAVSVQSLSAGHLNWFSMAKNVCKWIEVFVGVEEETELTGRIMEKIQNIYVFIHSLLIR